jgi:2-oxoglutarate ferredoxin oxidoreductase subunit delta
MRFWRIPLDHDDVKIPHGEITIIPARCKGCEICLTYCPRDVLTISAEFNAKGYHYPRAARGSDCVACGLCQIMCPEFAIYVTEAVRA